MTGAGTASVPVLETARLLLRGHRHDDFESLAQAWADPAVMHFLGGKTLARDEAWGRMLRFPGLWHLLGYGYWAVEEKASGRCIGNIGYADFKREIEPPLGDLPELGWMLAADAHGKGYASEALAAVLAWGRTYFGVHRAVCIIDAENTASLRMASKAGFAFSHEAIFHSAPIRVYIRDEA
jgi:RimJ/RimL family protein N-acetyltransferase